MQLRFIVLEDSPILTNILRVNLKLAYGSKHSVDVYESLSSFINRFDPQAHDILIVDLNVLDAKPEQVAKYLLALPEAVATRVIIHTSESWLTIARLGLANFYTLPKVAAPFVIRQLVEGMLTLAKA